MSSTGNALPKDFGDGGLTIFGPDNGGFRLPVAVRVCDCGPCVGWQGVLGAWNVRCRPVPALCLSKTVCGLAQFVRVSNLLASRESQERMKSGINAYGSISRVGNALRVGVDKQAQIPTRGPLDDTSAFDPALGKVLGMKPHMAYPRNVDARASGALKGSGNGMLVS